MSQNDSPTQELMTRPTRDARMAKQGCIPIPEASARLRVSDKRVYALASKGELKLRRLGGAVYVTTKSVEAYEQRTSVGPNMLTLAKVNTKYGYSRATLFRMVKQGRLHPTYIKRLLYLDKDECDRELLGKGAAVAK